MIIVKLKGGLGNQLFQYAFGRRMSIFRHEKLKLDKDILGEKGDTYRYYGLDNYNIKADIASKEEVQKFKYPLGLFSKFLRFLKGKVLKIYHVGYEPELLKSKSIYLDGYFQSYKYLEPIKNDLLKEITLKEPIENKYFDLLQKINNNNSVSIHIRRGDYINNNDYCTYGLEYYNEAIKIIKEKISDPIFFVFSDEITWAKENFKLNNIFFVSSPAMKDYEELILMTKCKHNIIANSSFSFWGAWLNKNPDKTVIAPKKWCNKFIKEFRDLLPVSWIRI
jgi:hypothetical protein